MQVSQRLCKLENLLPQYFRPMGTLTITTGKTLHKFFLAHLWLLQISTCWNSFSEAVQMEVHAVKTLSSLVLPSYMPFRVLLAIVLCPWFSTICRFHTGSLCSPLPGWGWVVLSLTNIQISFGLVSVGGTSSHTPICSDASCSLVFLAPVVLGCAMHHGFR